jgi:hypothetical protein
MGRDEELSALGRWLDEAVEGSGRLVLISGDAGIGKTALLQVFAARAERRGIAVHWGRCWEEEGAPAFWPWAEVMKSVIRSGPERSGPSVLEVSSTLSGSLPAEDAAREGGFVADARLWLFEATTDVFVEDESPSVILLAASPVSVEASSIGDGAGDRICTTRLRCGHARASAS